MSKPCLHEDQTDLALHQAWCLQRGVCTSCEDRRPWHRGIVVKRGNSRAWMCLVCALLKGAEHTEPMRITANWQENRDHVPVPDGYTLVWIHSDWIPLKSLSQRTDPIQLGRRIGTPAARRIWAATHEDSWLVKRRPWSPERGGTVPALLPEIPVHRLSHYIGTTEERQTTAYIHGRIGLIEDDFPSREIERDGVVCELPYLDPQTLAQVAGWQGVKRRSEVPRVGLTGAEHWHSLDATKQPPLGVHARTIELGDNLLLYFASLRDCEYMYATTPEDRLRLPYEKMHQKVGYGLADVIDPESGSEQPLWDRVFGIEHEEEAAQ